MTVYLVVMRASIYNNRVFPIWCPDWSPHIRSLVLIPAVVGSTLTPTLAQEALGPTFQPSMATLASQATGVPDFSPLDTTRKPGTNRSVGPAVLGGLVGSLAGGFLRAGAGAIAECGPSEIGGQCGVQGAIYGLAIGSLLGSTLGATLATRRFKCAPPGNFRRAALGAIVGSLAGVLLLTVHGSGPLLVPVGQVVGIGMAFKRC